MTTKIIITKSSIDFLFKFARKINSGRVTEYDGIYIRRCNDYNIQFSTMSVKSSQMIVNKDLYTVNINNIPMDLKRRYLQIISL